MAAHELRWLTYLLTDLGEQPRSPPVLCRGQLRLAYVATRANTADIFTKALPPGDHQRFSTVLGLLGLLFLSGLVTTCSPPLCLWGPAGHLPLIVEHLTTTAIYSSSPSSSTSSMASSSSVDPFLNLPRCVHGVVHLHLSGIAHVREDQVILAPIRGVGDAASLERVDDEGLRDGGPGRGNQQQDQICTRLLEVACSGERRGERQDFVNDGGAGWAIGTIKKFLTSRDEGVDDRGDKQIVVHL
ncbi:unnamed protein product [Closterium sp. NIES-53]